MEEKLIVRMRVYLFLVLLKIDIFLPFKEYISSVQIIFQVLLKQG